MSERLAQAADLVRDLVTGLFVDASKRTVQPIDDTPQAKGNVEAIHDREIAAPSAESQTAQDDRMMSAAAGAQEKDLSIFRQSSARRRRPRQIV